MATTRNAFSGRTLEQVTGRFLVNLLTEKAESDPKRSGKLLKKLLEEHGLSQSGAARELGIGDRTMRKYIAGDLALPRLLAWALAGMIQITGGRSDWDQPGAAAKAGRGK